MAGIYELVIFDAGPKKKLNTNLAHLDVSFHQFKHWHYNK